MQEKLQILTLSPFTIEKTQHFFSTTNYMVKKSRKLREMNGVMSVPQKMSKGRKLTEELKADVAAFYESDEVSRMRAGKDTVRIRLPSGEKGNTQKRLVLVLASRSYTLTSRRHTLILKWGFQPLLLFVLHIVFWLVHQALTPFVCVFTIRTPNSCFSPSLKSWILLSA